VPYATASERAEDDEAQLVLVQMLPETSSRAGRRWLQQVRLAEVGWHAMTLIMQLLSLGFGQSLRLQDLIR
jgi:hypothetical protein